MIQPKAATIGEILSLSKNFNVPKYQRGYEWEPSEASEYLEDLAEETGSGRGLFLGTVIFNVLDDVHDNITIVDGQQRLTTIFILLIACRQLAKKLKAEGIAQETQKSITVTDRATAKSRGPLLGASESIRDVFYRMAASDWDGEFTPKIEGKSVKRQNNRIRPIYDSFQKKIESFDHDQLSKLLDSIYRTRVIRIDIDGGEEACSIFERTNARGTDLEVSDLLKNYLYQQDVPDMDDKWKEIIDNSDRTILKMLKYFYVANKGYIRKSDLFPNLKKYAKAQGGATVVVEELRLFSIFYKTARREENATFIKTYFESIGCKAISSDADKYHRVHLSLKALRLFRVSQIYPLIFAAITALMRNGGGNERQSAKILIKLLDSMEKYHFVNNAVCNRVGNEVEKLYAGYCEKYSKTTDLEKTTDELIAHLRRQLALENEFTSRFTEIAYAPENNPLIAYIFDRFNNYNAAPGERVEIFDPQSGVKRHNHNIEHFLAQKPEGEAVIDSATAQLMNNIGNLLPMSFRANSSLGNLSPSKKIQRLKGDLAKKVENLRIVREFIDKYGPKAESWNAEAITERARDMSLEAYRRVWALK